MILITGSATRIGAAIAYRIAKNNKVIIHYHQSAKQAELIASQLDNAILWQQDLCAPDLAKNFQILSSQHGPIDTLINNAAVFYPEQDNENISAELRNEIMAVNYRAPMILMQEFAAAYRASKSSSRAAGNIINILDQRILNPSHAFPAYTESKMKLWQATQQMAVELAPHIRVNAIAPGHVLPNVGEAEEKFHARRAKTPMGMGPEPDDIAATVEFILGMKSMTGACIPLDGGEHLVPKIKAIS